MNAAAKAPVAVAVAIAVAVAVAVAVVAGMEVACLAGADRLTGSTDWVAMSTDYGTRCCFASFFSDLIQINPNIQSI
eukprot:gene410-3756_t